MHERKRLNKRGKIAITCLLAIAVFSFIGLFSSGGTVKEKKPASAETLSLSFDSMDSFGESELNQSIEEKESQKKEKAREKAFTKQNKQDQKENAIYLTFDDGPSEDADELLDTLNEYDMKATFFMLGPNMEDNSEVVKRMKKEGFGLALHGITHEVDQIYSDSSAPVDEMKEDQEILKDITGFSSDMVRLPYGSVPYLSEDMRELLYQDDFNVWDWNVDSEDWDLTDGSYVQQTIQEIERMEDEDETPIVLLHDKKETVEHLPELLSYIKKQGYKTKVLSNDTVPLTFPCEGDCH